MAFPHELTADEKYDNYVCVQASLGRVGSA